MLMLHPSLPGAQFQYGLFVAVLSGHLCVDNERHGAEERLRDRPEEEEEAAIHVGFF